MFVACFEPTSDPQLTVGQKSGISEDILVDDSDTRHFVKFLSNARTNLHCKSCFTIKYTMKQCVPINFGIYVFSMAKKVSLWDNNLVRH